MKEKENVMDKDLKEKIIKRLKEARIPTDVKIPEFYLRIQNIINHCPEPCLEYLEIVLNEDAKKFAEKIYKNMIFTVIFRLSYKISDFFLDNDIPSKDNYYDECKFYGILLALDMFTNTEIIYNYLKARNITKLNNIQREILFCQIFYNEYLKIPCFADAHWKLLNFEKSKKIKCLAAYQNSFENNHIEINEYYLHNDDGYNIYSTIMHELIHFCQSVGYNFCINIPDIFHKNYSSLLCNIKYCDMQIRPLDFVFDTRYKYSQCKYVSVLSKIFYYMTFDEIEANNISYKKATKLMKISNDSDEELLIKEKHYENNLEKQYDKIKKRYHIEQFDNNIIQNEYNYAIYHLIHNENPESYLQAMLMYDVMNVIICQDYIDAGLTFDEDRFELETMNTILKRYGFSKIFFTEI